MTDGCILHRISTKYMAGIARFAETLGNCLLGDLDPACLSSGGILPVILNLLDVSWRNGNGPLRHSLMSRCCVTASRNIDIPALVGLGCGYDIQGKHASSMISARYVWLLAPYVLIRTCFYLCTTDSAIFPRRKEMIQRLLPYLLNHLYDRSAFCEVRPYY